ncbi:MAG TPA: DUF2807 domain-containing protein [Rhizomicrobium sp.]|jgi:hypothetical protein|nr:DUF2807 domain-containing protein [Rhizomicrobium sp.]
MKLMISLASACLLLAAPAFAGPALQLGGFSSVKASDGAKVTIRHGAVQSVTLIAGNTELSRLDVEDGRLSIEGCVHRCPRNYRLEVEIVTPNITAIEAEDGASIEVQGSFPAQGNLAAKAQDGGNIDARSIPAANVNAKAEDGGVIEVSATRTLSAAAEDGGDITYWGHPTVNMHTSDGGNIEQGS